MLLGILNRDRDFSVKSAAACTLCRVGTKKSADALCEFWGESITYKYDALAYLTSIGDSRAVDPLCAILAKGMYSDKLFAVEKLIRVADERAIEPLARALNNNFLESDIRRLAARALGLTKDERAIGVLCSAYKNADTSLRREIEHGLELIGSNGIETLCRYLKNDDSDVRIAVVKALGALGDGTAAVPLSEIIAEGNNEVISAVCDAFMNMRGQAIEALKPLLSNSSVTLRRVAQALPS